MMRFKLRIKSILAALTITVSALWLSTGAAVGGQAAAARGEAIELRPQGVVLGQYIVVFRDYVAGPKDLADALGQWHGFTPHRTYQHALKGFAARMPASVAQALALDPDVAFVEPDVYAYSTAQQTPTGVARIGVNPNATINCTSVNIAIIDTGIDLDHPDLNVYVDGSKSFIGDNTGSPDDDHGHGTHVAGIAAAKNDDIGVVGVCPGARLWAFKVLDSTGSGFFSDIIEGVDYVTANAPANGGPIAVANMSLGGIGYLASFRAAIQNSVSKGVVYVVAAGNNAMDVYGANGHLDTAADYDAFLCFLLGQNCGDDFMPAAYPEVATISAMADSNGVAGGGGSSTNYGPDDSFATFSNFSNSVAAGNPVDSPGRAIDLLMPGVNIFSTWKGGEYHTISGTSMASPHAAGLAARHIAANSCPGKQGAEFVYCIRQAMINTGVVQNGNCGLNTLNDRDIYWEKIGWAGSACGASSLPGITINNVNVTEVNAGQTIGATFTVSLSQASAAQVTVNFATANGSATAGSDYGAISQTPLTFSAGETTKSITVQVIGDNIVESNENFFVNLSNAINATIINGQGVGTINNDDSATIAISDMSLTEGDSGTKGFTFNVALTGTVANSFVVNFATTNGSATTANNDYVSASGVLTFGGGNSATQQITVNVTGDTAVELDENFFINLTGTLPAGVSFADAQGVGTIKNDDTSPTGPVQIAFDDFASGTWSGGTGWSGSWTRSGDASIVANELRLRRSTGLASRSVNLSAYSGSTVYLSFCARVNSFENNDKAEVKVNGAVVKTFLPANSDNIIHCYGDNREFPLPAGAVTVAIVFDAGMSSQNDQLYIDNVKVWK